MNYADNLPEDVQAEMDGLCDDIRDLLIDYMQHVEVKPGFATVLFLMATMRACVELLREQGATVEQATLQ